MSGRHFTVEDLPAMGDTIEVDGFSAVVTSVGLDRGARVDKEGREHAHVRFNLWAGTDDEAHPF